MNRTFFLRLSQWFGAYGDLLRYRTKELFFAGFAVGAAMSAGDRHIYEALNSSPWAWVEAFHTVLRDKGWETASVASDIRNGIVLGANLVLAPAMIYWCIHLTYVAALWVGTAGLVMWASPRVTDYANLDLLLWPACAGIAQAIGVRLIFRRMLRCGKQSVVGLMQNVGAAVAATVALAWPLALLAPILHLGLVGFQCGVEWFFSR